MILETLPKEELEKLIKHINAEIDCIENEIENFTLEDLYNIEKGITTIAKIRFLSEYRKEVFELKWKKEKM